MAERRQPVRRVLRLTAEPSASRGSVIVEGLASMFVFFVLLMLVVQIGFYVMARNATSVAVEGAVRDVARDPDAAAAVQQRLERDLLATVPGATDVAIEVTTSGSLVRGVVSFEWVPPGPDLAPLTVTVARSAVMGIPP